MRAVRYLTVAEVIVIHDEVMRRTGYRPEGLRDEGLLESALMRGQAAAYYENADLVRQAVVMAVGISQNQPFVDGNKRAALAVLDVFLRVNGHMLNAPPLEIARRLESMTKPDQDRSDAIEHLVEWVREHTAKLSARS
jgi:death on curing protein